MKRIFILLGMLFSIHTVFSQNIIKAEYFFDVDLGPGNGTAVPGFVAGDIVNFPVTVPTSALSSGFHSLNIRVADANGVWSRYETRGFYLSTTATTNTTNITGAEYFIDADPGLGNGTPANVGSPGPVVNFVVPVPVALNSGFHFLAIRVRDQEGRWSMFEQRGFYLVSNPVNASPIVAAEYFYDIDPGTGSAAPLSITTPGDIITQTFMVPVPISLSQGIHVLAIRVKDQEGHWSSFEKDTITVGAVSGSITCPANVVVSSPAGQCSTIVNSIDPAILPAGSLYTYSLTGATTGSGNGTAGGKTFNTGVTTVTYALTNSPATVCSFTVTVNSNITPSVSIIASSLNVCSGQQVTFTATPVNGGATPSYQWKLNGNNIPGAISSTYQSSSLVNDDVISVVMTSSFACANPLSVPSNNIPIAVTPSVAPTVSISVSATTICSGTTVTFNATPADGGANPTYQWKLNGNNVGTNSTAYQNPSLQNGDKVKVVLTSSAACASPLSAVSEEVTMTVNTAAIPSVTIDANEESICYGQSVTFTATPNNAGNNPVYEWTLNYNAVGTNSPVFQSSTLVDGDVVRVTMVPSQNCGTNTPVVSNMITMTVGANVTPSVTMSYSASSYCTGSLIIFYSSPLSGAGNSPSYQWKRNGINIPGATSSTYQSSSLENGDVIRVAMTSSLSCANPQTVLSHDSATMIISSVALTPLVTISAPSATICQGETVTFTALPTNGGDVPGYQWKLNGINVGDNADTFSTNLLQNGDVITVEMLTSVPCFTSPTAISSPFTMTVGSGVTPSVSINASAIDICPGQQVTFTATPTNGGNNPTYQWKLNGNNIGSNSPTYQTTSLENADTIKVVMTSLLGCVASPIATSNYISMDVSTSVLPSVSITADLTYICQGELVKFTATPINGGNNPTYQWRLNGNNVGNNSHIYQSTSFANNDSIEVVMSSSLGCAAPQSATSNNIFMTVTTAVTPQVSIESPSPYVCPGTLVTFTATPVNGGTPSYQWKLNGNNVGTDYYKYENSNLSAGDVISVLMTTTLSCVTTSMAVSNGITMEASSSSATYYRDLDGDGYGNSSSGTIQACGITAGYVSNNSDCNDNNAAVFPGAAEACGNGIDDNCNGQTDENCTEDLPVLIVKTYPAKEGDVGYTTVDIEVKLDRLAVSAVRLNYATSNDDAIAGSDYVAANGVLIIPQGSTSATIQIKVIGDLLRESNERFWLNFTNPVNVVLPDDPRCRIMIIDNDKGKVTNTIVNNDQAPVREEIFKIPTVTKRNQVWVIPQIGNYENEVLIVNVQGQLVRRFVNYHNQTALGNVSKGLYFYRIRIMENPGQYKYYSGRLLITE